MKSEPNSKDTKIALRPSLSLPINIINHSARHQRLIDNCKKQSKQIINEGATLDKKIVKRNLSREASFSPYLVPIQRKTNDSFSDDDRTQQSTLFVRPISPPLKLATTTTSAARQDRPSYQKIQLCARKSEGYPTNSSSNLNQKPPSSQINSHRKLCQTLSQPTSILNQNRSQRNSISMTISSQLSNNQKSFYSQENNFGSNNNLRTLQKANSLTLSTGSIPNVHSSIGNLESIHDSFEKIDLGRSQLRFVLGKRWNTEW